MPTDLNDTTDMEFRDLIRTRRKALGLSQVDLAERVGMSQEWMSRVERGGNKGALKSHLLVRLADALGLPYDQLAVASGIVRTKNAALALLRQFERSEVEQDRLAELHDQIDDYLLAMDNDDFKTILRLAETLAAHATGANATTPAGPDRDRDPADRPDVTPASHPENTEPRQDAPSRPPSDSGQSTAPCT